MSTISTSVTDPPVQVAVPLGVDLDGTLVKTDLLLESFLALVKQRPLALLLLPLWLLRGKAHLKREIAQRVTLDVTCLPYREPLLLFLQAEHKLGRKLILATAADQRIAQQIADHLGIFDTVIGSDGTVNLSGEAKAQALENTCSGPFAYAGDAPIDLQVWQRAQSAVLVGGGVKFASQLKHVEHIFIEERRPKQLLRALRLHQWAKNVLIFLPLLLAHQAANLPSVLAAALAFLAFGLCASSVYVQNDLLDLEADRHHRSKRFRPFASGAFSIKSGLLLAPLLLLAAAATALLLSPAFLGVLALYFVTTFSYSLFFKQKAVIDVLMLAGLYTVRIVAGGVAVGVGLSPWLLAFSMFFFLSLAYVKRFTELRDLPLTASLRSRGYVSGDLEGLADLGVASGYISVLVVALYINSEAVQTLYRTPAALWLLCPLLLYWLSRVWLLTRRGEMHDDPVIFALKDRNSYVIGGLAVLVAVVAAGGFR